MNMPALAPVLPGPTPHPMPGPAPAGDPGAFARELRSASQPQPCAVDGDRPAAAAPETSDEGFDVTTRSRGELGDSATRAGARRTTLERWSTQAGGIADDPAAAARLDAAAQSLAGDGEPVPTTRAGSEDAAAAASAPAWPATLVLRPPTEPAAAAERTVAVSQATPASRAADNEAPEADHDPLRGGRDALTAGALAARTPVNVAAAAAADAAARPAPVKADPETAQTAAMRLASLAADGDRPAAGVSPSALPAPGATPLSGMATELLRPGLAAAAGGSPAAGPARAEFHLPTPVAAPDFVPRLVGELAVLARNGVQEARVQVNPLELGPISVQITLDGNAAQVRLGVDSAHTRELLQQGLPALAAALRETGLTLAGGGVFQQPRDPGRDGQRPDKSPGRGSDAVGDGAADTVAEVTTTRHLRHPGQVDVFA